MAKLPPPLPPRDPAGQIGAGPPQRRPAGARHWRRRDLLVGVPATAAAAGLAFVAAPAATREPVAERCGQPFADGSWFDDGTGWID